MQTGDHTLDHLNFEGLTGKEGDEVRGAVIVWDRGTWEPTADPHEGVLAGKLEFLIHGQKLRGNAGYPPLDERRRPRRQELALMKGKDEHVRHGAEADIVTREPASVLSGRTLEDLKRAF